MVSVPGAATSSTISQKKIYWLSIQRQISRSKHRNNTKVSTAIKRFCLTLLQTKKIRLDQLVFNQNKLFSRQHWGQAT
jgi:hypothetical protein